MVTLPAAEAPRLEAICAAVLPLPYRFETSPFDATLLPIAAQPVLVPLPVTGPQFVWCVVPLPGFTPGCESLIEALDGFELELDVVEDESAFFAWPLFCDCCWLDESVVEDCCWVASCFFSCPGGVCEFADAAAVESADGAFPLPFPFPLPLPAIAVPANSASPSTRAITAVVRLTFMLLVSSWSDGQIWRLDLFSERARWQSGYSFKGIPLRFCGLRGAAQARKTAPKRPASASTMRFRSAAASSSVSVRSGDWKATAKASDFRPSPSSGLRYSSNTRTSRSSGPAASRIASSSSWAPTASGTTNARSWRTAGKPITSRYST